MSRLKPKKMGFHCRTRILKMVTDFQESDRQLCLLEINSYHQRYMKLHKSYCKLRTIKSHNFVKYNDKELSDICFCCFNPKDLHLLKFV